MPADFAVVEALLEVASRVCCCKKNVAKEGEGTMQTLEAQAAHLRKSVYWSYWAMVTFVLAEALFDIFASISLLSTTDQGTLIFIALGLAITVLALTFWVDIQGFLTCTYSETVLNAANLTPPNITTRRRWMVRSHRLADLADLLLLIRLLQSNDAGECVPVRFVDVVIMVLLCLSSCAVAFDALTWQGVDKTQGGLYFLLVTATFALMASGAVAESNDLDSYFNLFPTGVLSLALFLGIWNRFRDVYLVVPVSAIILAFVDTFTDTCNREAVFLTMAVFSGVPAVVYSLRRWGYLSSTRAQERAGLALTMPWGGWQKHITRDAMNYPAIVNGLAISRARFQANQQGVPVAAELTEEQAAAAVMPSANP